MLYVPRAHQVEAHQWTGRAEEVPTDFVAVNAWVGDQVTVRVEHEWDLIVLYVEQLPTWSVRVPPGHYVVRDDWGFTCEPPERFEARYQAL